jgi:hypothetical protein
MLEYLEKNKRNIGLPGEAADDDCVGEMSQKEQESF